MPKQTFDNNNAIRGRLLLAELASVTGAAQATELLIRMYTTLGEDRFYIALAPIARMAGLTADQLKKEIDAIGGAESVLNFLQQGTTFGLGPDINHLYVLANNDLGVPAGEYKINEPLNVEGDFYQVQAKNNLAGYVDWVFGIPNVSWIGDWEKIPVPSQSALEMALTPAEYAAFQASGGTPDKPSRGSKKQVNPLTWLLIGAAFLFFRRK